jgi:hypothetical protein
LQIHSPIVSTNNKKAKKKNTPIPTKITTQIGLKTKSAPASVGRIVVAVVALEGSLSLTVVDKAEGVVVIFGREYAPETVRAGKSEGIVDGEGVVRDGRGRDGTGDGTKGGVVVVCSNAIANNEQFLSYPHCLFPS